jgi:galactokinase
MSEVRADAPGRVNLIGEHTDYQDGLVLPCAVPQRTRAALRPVGGRRVTVWSEQIGPEPFAYDLGAESRGAGWADYVQGLTWVLRGQPALTGFDLLLQSNVPIGGGLSSSAALEVSVLRAIRRAFGIAMNDIALARAAQRAEVEFVGAPVGIMDQMAASLANEREALFIDTRSLEYERIPLPPSLDLVVIDSGIAHQHAGGDYVTRRRESEEAARLLGVDRLREVGIADLPRLAALPAVLARRARHIVTENQRVMEARDALIEADLPRLGELFRASHASLRDDYQVSIEAIDLLVDLTSAEPGVFGARMTGGGFGGAIVAIAASGSGAASGERAAREYERRTGRRATVLVPPPC